MYAEINTEINYLQVHKISAQYLKLVTTFLEIATGSFRKSFFLYASFPVNWNEYSKIGPIFKIIFCFFLLYFGLPIRVVFTKTNLAFCDQKKGQQSPNTNISLIFQ